MDITKLVEKNNTLLRLGLNFDVPDARMRVAKHLQDNNDSIRLLRIGSQQEQGGWNETMCRLIDKIWADDDYPWWSCIMYNERLNFYGNNFLGAFNEDNRKRERGRGALNNRNVFFIYIYMSVQKWFYQGTWQIIIENNHNLVY